MKTVKYPKTLVKAEISSRRQLKSTELVDEQQKIIEEKISELNKGSFELAGVFPYIFDVLCYVCTHAKEAIERRGNNSETHFRVKIPTEAFYDFALDGELDQKHKLLKELLELHQNPKTKALPLNADLSISTQPIRIDLIHQNGRRITGNLKNLQQGGQEIKFIIIEFYKPLFSQLLEGRHGKAWFILPKAFHAKMLKAIKQYKDLPEFKRYGNLATSINYRKLYLYFNLHDNKKGDYLTYDSVDLAEHCLPENISEKNGKAYLDNWFKLHQFTQKGTRLFHKMGQDGLLKGVEIIPTSIWYEKPAKEIRIKLKRNAIEIPEFTDETPFQGAEYYVE